MGERVGRKRRESGVGKDYGGSAPCLASRGLSPSSLSKPKTHSRLTPICFWNARSCCWGKRKGSGVEGVE
jgi:hypothetical protein